MILRGICSFLLLVVLSSSCLAQEKASGNLILKVDQTVSGPFGGQRSLTCLRVFADGKVLYATWWNSAATLIDKGTGRESRPEYTVSKEYRLEDTDVWDLSSLLESKAVKKLREEFGPPHPPIDYFESTSVEIMERKGKPKRISTREFYVADLEEKTRYPSALIVLMDRIDEIQKEAYEKGKPTQVPTDCGLKP